MQVVSEKSTNQGPVKKGLVMSYIYASNIPLQTRFGKRLKNMTDEEVGLRAATAEFGAIGDRLVLRPYWWIRAMRANHELRKRGLLKSEGLDTKA